MEGPCRHTRRPILVCVKSAKMLTNDLVRCVALDALGPGIPANDVALFVQLEDRIIDNGVDELSILRLTFCQVLFDSATVRLATAFSLCRYYFFHSHSPEY